MPREQQKRGRRAEKKAQKDDSKRKFEETPEDPVAKRMKPSADDETNEANDDIQLPENEDYIPLDQGEQQVQQEGEQPDLDGDMPFYGLLDEEESEYFQRANEMLELNEFQDAEERSLFVDSVYSEASGKELKIACSQGCSRLMEKLISMSNAQQLRRIFSKFIGHFLHLVQHRFASHCCETLFIHAAPAVMQKTKPQTKKSDEDEGEEEPELTLAEMFMAVIEELKENWGYLLTERFASHTIRVLLLVLAGEPVDVTSNESFVASRKKERIEIKAIQGEEKVDKSKAEKHTVPATFEPALKKIMTDMVAGLDDVYLRALATHPVGNPVLQVLLFLELSHFGKSSAKDPKSTIRRLVPDESFEEESESAIFIRGLLYDPVGSRLLETMVRYLPGKSFKNLYKNNLGDRIGSLARNSTAGYVVLRMLERLGKDDLKIAMTNIIPEVPGLIERSRLIVPKMLIERCVVRGVDTKPLAEALEGAYSQDPVIRLQQMLKFNPSENTAPQTEDHDMDGDNDGKERKPRGPPPVSAAEKAEKLHASLLVQAMLTVPGPMSQLVYTSLLAQSPEIIVQLAQEPTSSRVLQQALTSTTSTPQIRRQLTTRFQGHLTPLALSSSGSHVVDALWTATKDIFFVKERMAQELEQHEQELRDSFVGRAVWRNWSMDLFKRRRRDWAHKAKGLEERTESNEGAARPVSKLDQARARYAAAKEAADAGATGANQTAVSSRQ
ncbi:Armadillo-like helical [Penicillium concentricum]|uniref:Nucleolar protein 9 n=1 Tax=Penicillium concentricum TaxID=293559 RepID=A0A9W9SQL3_9EURO|nr:Armadillo-like helical [Penicillium concentricum]KAJ5382761.1 Armadillo-like helical [Penicillium concentricum]